MKFVTVGNCQAQEVAVWIKALTGTDAVYARTSTLRSDAGSLGQALLEDCAAVFAMPGTPPGFIEAATARRVPVHEVPRLFFTGFHPDLLYPTTATAERPSPVGNVNSAILLHAWRNGLNVTEALRLFDAPVFLALGYREAWAEAVDALFDEGRSRGIDFEPMLDGWMQDGNFMHQPLHPKIRVMESISRTLLHKAGIELLSPGQQGEVRDTFAFNAVFPVYPEIAHWLGVKGDYLFLPKNTSRRLGDAFKPLDLEAFVEATFEVYRSNPPELAAFPRLNSAMFDEISGFLSAARTRPPAGKSKNPYRKKPDTAFWRKAVSDLPMEAVDPMVGPAIQIGPQTTIVTAGSCFAQHISRTLQAAGYRYLVTEDAPADASPEFRKDGNYGVFSARYGNIYTTRQLVQLIDRAYGTFQPLQRVWEQDNGRFVDPFRPEIQAGGLDSAEAVIAAQDIHLAAVRQALEQADIFVFTLGLTEAWVARADGAVVPLAPGVARANVDPAEYKPVNYDIDKIRGDLAGFIERLGRINPDAKVILTVSPVPLIATFGGAHVLSATTYSKSVLRVAAQECADGFAHVEYFPSYEVITGAFNRGRYFEDDLRSVTPEGVAHVMRLFMKHHTQEAIAPRPATPAQDDDRRAARRAEIAAGMEIVCDEEKIVSDLR